MAKSPQMISANWANKMAQAGENTKNGVMSVTQAPGQAAAAQASNYLAGVNSSVDKWKQNVAAVSTSSWQNSMIQKGIPRMTQGATQAKDKVAAFHSQLQPYQENLKNQLPARGPKGSNGPRMMAWMEGMLRFRKNGG